MELKETQKKRLRGLAHTLKPVIMIGQHGLKDSILEELDNALDYHQLVKIKVSVGDREARDQIIQSLLNHATKARLIQQTGNMAVLYQRNPKKADLLTNSV